MGFVMIDRSITDDPEFLSKPFCKLGFLTYLHSIAAFYPHDKWFGGVKLHLEKGEFAISIRSLAAQVGWDKGRVKRFLKRLEERTIIAPLNDTPVNHWRLRGIRAEEGSCTASAPTDAPPMHPQHNTKEIITNNKTKTKPCRVAPATRQAEGVFDHWKLIMNSPGSKFDDKRKKVVKARLKDGYSVNDLKEAIEGMKNCPHNMGQNEQGVVYNRIGIVCKDGESVDRFREMYKTPPVPNTGGLTIDQSIADGLATARRIEERRALEQHENMITDQNNNNKIGETYDNSEGNTE